MSYDPLRCEHCEALERERDQMRSYAEQLTRVLSEDAAGRPASETLRMARESCINMGADGPLLDCMALLADAIDAALAKNPNPSGTSGEASNGPEASRPVGLGPFTEAERDAVREQYSQGSDWVALAYAKLGMVRDDMTPKAVAAVQDFLGPLSRNEIRGGRASRRQGRDG